MNIAGQFPHYPPSTTESDLSSRSFSLIQLKAFLGRQWRLIAATTFLSMVLSVAYIVMTPNRYTARTDMIIDTKKIVWMQSEMSNESRGMDDASVESEIETTKSEKVAKSVVRRLGLDTDPEFVGSPGFGLWQRITSFVSTPEKWSKYSAKVGEQAASPVAASPVQDTDPMQLAIATLASNLRVMRVGRSYHQEIAYTSLDPVKAARISNAFADAYVEDQLEAKFESTRRASDWLQHRIEELRQQATDAFKAVQDYKASQNIIIGVDGKLASDIELDQLGVALAKARADTSQARVRLDRITAVLDQRTKRLDFNIPNPVVTDALSSPIITKLRQQFLEDQNKMTEWTVKYGAGHIAVQNLRANMLTLQNAMWDELSRISESYKSEYQIAKNQEEAVDKRMTDIFQQSSATRQSQVRLRELETAATSYRNIYETFLSRFTQSVQQQSFPTTEARIVTEATPPRKPSSPKVTLTLALAVVCGLIAGVTWGLVREQVDRQVYTRSQLEQLLGITCLAVLPAFSARRTFAGKFRAEQSSAFRQIGEVAPFSATAEALRYIKVAIDLHRSEGNGKVIGIVSALPGEGKTTVAASFAAFVAKNGARTVLIDADLRKASATRLLNHSNKPGLINMDAEGADYETFLIKDLQNKFDFMPASTHMKFSNSSDILNSPTVRDMLAKVKDKYDYILVDLPPILPVVDVKAIAHLFDAFVMVVEWGSTSTEEILNAATASPILTERLLGTVLNKVDEAVMRRFEGYSDRRHGYYTDSVPRANA